MSSTEKVKTASGFQSFHYLNPLRIFYEKAGIDYDQMLEIIQLKAKILGRTEQAQIAKSKANRRKLKAKYDQKEVSSEVSPKDPGLFSMGKAISYLVTSAFIMLYGFIFNEPTTMLSIIFTVGFVMQFLGIVTSFPVLILDTKDYTVLSTKPIDTRTLSAAKTTTAALYMLFSSGAIYGFTFIPFLFKGFYSIIPMMLIAVIFSNLICVALSYMLYGVVLKFYDGEKLKDILSIFQIFLTIFIMVGYQVIAQLQNIVNVATLVSFQWWHLLVPPFWLSNFSATLYSKATLLPGFMSAVAILLLMFVHFRYTGKLLEENLNKMLSDGEVKRSSYMRKVGRQEWLSRLIYKDPQDRAFFMLGYSVSTNDRKMKQTIYPLYVSMIILPALMIFNAWRENEGSLSSVFKQNSWLIFFLYFAGLTIGSIVLYAKRTENPKGAWLYEVLPIRSQRRAYKAVAANMIIRYVAIPMMFFVVLMGSLAGPTSYLSLCLIYVFTLVTTFATLKSEKIDWPFSYDLTYAEGKKGIMILVNFAALAAFVGLHAVCQYFLNPYGVPILLVLTIGFAILLWKKI